MSQRKLLTLLGMAITSIVLAVLALTQAVADPPASTGAPAAIGFNWPSIVLALLGIIVGIAAAWAVQGERVKQHGQEIKKLFELYASIPVLFVSKELCIAREAANLAPGIAREAAATSGRADSAATSAASIVEHANAQQHSDMQALTASIGTLLKKLDGGGVKL